METLTMEEIKATYPNQWVLIGNPELRNPTTNGSFIHRLISGVVLLSNKDKRELAYQAKQVVASYDETICIYTGEVAQNRIFLLQNKLIANNKNINSLSRQPTASPPSPLLMEGSGEAFLTVCAASTNNN